MKVELNNEEIQLIIDSLDQTMDEYDDPGDDPKYWIASKLRGALGTTKDIDESFSEMGLGDDFNELNESASLLDKVKYKGQTGYVNGQMNDGKLIVQVQGSTYVVDAKDLKEMHPRTDKVMDPKVPQFNDQTQKILLEQYVRCGIFYNSVPIKTNDCYVKYNQFTDAPEDGQIKVLVEGVSTFIPKTQIVIFENLNEFASEENYIPGVIID